MFIQDSSQTDGSGLTGLVFNSAGLTVYYIRQGDASPTQISLVTATVGTWVSGGFKEIDSVNMPGWYELHVPNAAIAAGAKSVGIHLKGATNMAPYPIELELDAINYQDATRAGLTALPNAAAGAEGGLGVLDAALNLPANVRRWLDVVPAALTATGKFLQAVVLRWLTDDAPGTPTALASNRVPSVDPNSGNLDAAVSSRLASSSYTAPDNAGIIAAAASAATAATQATGANTKAADIQTRIPDALDSGRIKAKLATDPPTAAQIDTQLSGTHGAGTWGPGGSAGANTVVITTVDDDTDEVLPDVLVTVKTSAGTQRDQGRTDDDGEFSTSLDDGSWKVSANPIPGYSAVTDQAFTVDEDPEAVEVRMSPIAVSAPASADFCTAYIDVFDDADTPTVGVLVTAIPATLPHLLSSAVLSGEERTATTNSSGRAELQLARGKKYRLRLKLEGINQVVTIPSAASVNLRSLL